MKRIFTAVAAALTLLACGASSAYDEGTHYQRLAKAQPTSTGDKIEVVEVFWYGCPHCYSLEPAVHEWLKTKPDNVEFVRLPAALNPSWAFHAKVYYTAEALGIVEQFHGAFFDEIHLKNKRMASEASVQAFFETLGVTKTDFESAWNSFGVDSKLRKAQQKAIGYQLRSVPAVIVDGKYKVTSQTAGGASQIFKVVNALAEKK
jgi:thiol:disulfide interchange protein DsbA